MSGDARLGAHPRPDGSTRFEVWAPDARRVDVVMDSAASETSHALSASSESDTWVGTVTGLGHGDRYRLVLDGGDPLPDPASGWQPGGVHGLSAIVDPSRFSWTDDGWAGLALAGAVLYELHVGTFTPDGTFDGAVGQLPRLVDLGITAVELMPVNAFPGTRNWGYDGVFVSAVQQSYGGPEGLARFVDAAHAFGLAVVLDVVYNHFGPEGNVLSRFGPYFTAAYRTPWGDAVNVAGAGSDGVRRTFVESAVRWIEDFHIDGLRLDAVGAIYDPTARPFLEQLTEAVHAAGRAAGRDVIVIAESSDNDPRLITPAADGGIGCDAVWNDDVHHALRVALTGDTRGYYVDYNGADDLAVALQHRWVFRGRRSEYRGRRHGRPVDHLPHRRLVVYSADHDQVGNTPFGQRPPFDHRQRLVAAATVLLSPFTPMLFMGEEYAEVAPFPYFVDHSDPELLEATRRGRLREFSGAEWTDEVADPADPATFSRAVLDPTLAETEPHRSVLAAYTELIALRRRHAVLTDPRADHQVTRTGDAIVVVRRLDDVTATVHLDLGDGSSDPTVPDGARVVFDTCDARWCAGSPTDATGASLTMAP